MPDFDTMDDSIASPDVSSLPVVSNNAPPLPSPTVQPPQRPPSLFRSLVAGALLGGLHGLANDNGARSFGGGIGNGVAGELNNEQTQQQMQVQQTQANTQNIDAQTKLVQAHVNQAMTAQKLASLDPTSPQFVAQTVGKMADQTLQAIRAGASVQTPLFDSATAAQQFIHDNHLDAGNFQVIPSAIRQADGSIKYGGVQFPDTPSTKDITMTVPGPDGKPIQQTIPAGTSLQKFNEYQTAAMHQQVDSVWKSADEKQKRAQQIQEDAQKQSKVVGYSTDQSGNTVYTNALAAQQAGQPFEEVKPAQLHADRFAVSALNDVQLNVNRYQSAAQNYQAANLSTSQKATDSVNLHAILNNAGAADFNVSIGEGGKLDLPVISGLLEGISRETKSEAYRALSPEGKALLNGYVRTLSSIPAWSRAITGSSRSSAEAMKLEMANIGDPSLDPRDILQKLDAFNENIGVVASNFPKNLPGIKSPTPVQPQNKPQMNFNLPNFMPTVGALGGR